MSAPKTSPVLDDYTAILRRGALVLGEAHNDPTARELVMALIADGHVTHLFLELGASPLTERATTSTSASSSSSSSSPPSSSSSSSSSASDAPQADRYLRAKARTRSGLEDDPARGLFAQRVLSDVDKACGNRVTFRALIEYAVPQGVRVYFYDVADTGARTNPRGMHKRNEAMADVFKSTIARASKRASKRAPTRASESPSGPKPPQEPREERKSVPVPTTEASLDADEVRREQRKIGAILLVGSDHLARPRLPLGRSLPTAAGIPLENVKKLS